MAARRYKRRADGRYCTTVWDGTYTDSGQKHRRTLYATTVRELDAKVREMAHAVETGNVIKSDGEDMLSLCACWFRAEKSRTAGNTQRMYKGVIERYFQTLSDVKVEDFGYVHVRRVLNEVDGHPRTQEMVLLTLRQIIQFAVREKRMAKNVADDLLECFPKIRHKSKEKRPLTPGEKEAVFKAVLKPMDKCFLFILYGCGLRREEALALETEDFDFQGHVNINKALAILEGTETELKAPKTDRGTRTLPIPSSVRGVVEEYARECAGPLFPAMTRSKYRRMWERIRKAIQEVCPESDGLTAHIFRHNYCSELCRKIPVLSLKNVARLLGDTDAMVLNVYSHLDIAREPTDEVVSDVF